MESKLLSSPCCGGVTCNVVVVVDASKPKIIGSTMEDLLLLGLEKLQQGDSLTLFGVLEAKVNPMVCMPEVMDSEVFNGTSTAILEQVIQATTAEYQQKSLRVKELCKEKEVHFQVLVKPGPLDNKATFEEFMGLETTLVILHRTMEKYKSFLSTRFSDHGARVLKESMMKCPEQEKQGGHDSSTVVLQGALRTATAASTMNQGLMYSITKREDFVPPVCALDNATVLPTEALCKSSAPASARSSLSHNVRPLACKVKIATDAPCEEWSVSSVRSSPSLVDAQNILSIKVAKASMADINSFSWMNQIPNQLDLTDTSTFSSSRPCSGSSMDAQTGSQTTDFSDISSSSTPTRANNTGIHPICVRPQRPTVTLKTIEMLEKAVEPKQESNGGNPKDLCLNNPHVPQPLKFTDYDLMKATSGFSQDNLLANSTTGFMFKGTLPDGQSVVIKENKLARIQSDELFATRVRILHAACHKNIVRIIGACVEKRILVYEHVTNWSLDWHLSLRNPVTMNWQRRQNVAVGAAKGLRLLHEGRFFPPIIHGDLRSKNILLTEKYEPKIADAGLKPDEVGTETCVIGATGYLAPEYVQSGVYTLKTDVYAFGVILLELITGRKANLQPAQQESLAKWARPLLERGKIQELMDARIINTINEQQLCSMALAARLCIKKDPEKRPTMTGVLRILETRNSCALVQSSIYQSKRDNKLAASAILPRETNTSMGRDSRKHIPRFPHTDCLQQTGYGSPAKPITSWQKPQQYQLPQYRQPPFTCLPPRPPHIPQGNSPKQKDSTPRNQPQ